MLVHARSLEHAPALDVRAVAVGVRECVQPATDHGLGLVGLGDDHRLEPVTFLGDVHVAAEEVHEVRAV